MATRIRYKVSLWHARGLRLCGAMLGRLHGVAREEDGSELVEFAISAALLYMLLFGVMDCSRALYVDHFLANAAREGTRYAMVRGDGWGASCASSASMSCTATSSDVQVYVQGLVSAGIQATSVTVRTSWPGTDANGASCHPARMNSPGCMVTVEVSYPFTFVSPLLPRSTLVLTSSANSTILQ